MFNWFKRTQKETPEQARLRLLAERKARMAAYKESAVYRSYSAPSPSPAPAAAPPSSGFDFTSAYVGYLVGSSGHSHAEPAPATHSFSSGGGGDYGGGGASSSWEPSSSSCSSSDSSSSSSDYSSSSSDSSSSSCSSGD